MTDLLLWLDLKNHLWPLELRKEWSSGRTGEWNYDKGMRYRKYGRDRRRETGLWTLKAISDVLHTDLTSNSPPALRSSGAASRNTHTHTHFQKLFSITSIKTSPALCLYIHELFKGLQRRCFHADVVNTDRPRADGHYQVHTHTHQTPSSCDD